VCYKFFYVKPETKKFLWGAGLLVVLMLIPYFQATDFSFILYDDDVYVYSNPAVLQGLSWPNVRVALTSICAANWHPLTMLSLMTDVSLFGAHAGAIHATNFVLHAASAVVLLAILWRLTGNLAAAWVAAALWALHPLRVESVVWVSQRKDVLSMLLALLAMLCYLIGLAPRDGSSGDRPRWRYLAAVLFALAFLAKPSVVTFPILAAILEYMIRGRVRWRNLTFMFLVSIAGMLATIYAQSLGGAVVSAAMLPMTVRLLNAVASVGVYCRQMIFPAWLALYYPMQLKVAPHLVVFGGLVCAGMAALVWFTAIRQRAREAGPLGWAGANLQSLFPYAAGILWFGIALGPMAGILQVGAHAHSDRATYWPAVGIAIAVAWGLTQLANRLQPRALSGVWAGSALVVCSLTTITAGQVKHWRDTESIMKWTIAQTGRNFLAEANLGYYLCTRSRAEEGVAHLLRSIQYVPAPQGVGLYAWGLTQTGNWTEAAKTAAWLRERAPREARGWLVLGMVSANEGKLEEAERLIRRALLLDVNAEMAWYEFGQVFARQQRWPEAVAAWRHACYLSSEIEPAVESLQRDGGHIANSPPVAWLDLLKNPETRQFPAP